MESSHEPDADDLRPEYDLSQLRGGVRGKYARRSRDGSHDEGYELTSAFPPNGPPVQGNGKLTPEEVDAFLARMTAALQPIFAKCVVPICGERGGVAVQCGTGTLFRVADVSFLVTASHVTENARERGYQLAVCDAAPGAPGIPLYGRWHGHTNFDVAVWELPSDVVNELPNRMFLTVHHADRANRRPKNGVYYVHGYPDLLTNVNTAEQKVSLMPFTYAAGIYKGETSGLPDYDPQLHLLLDTNKEDVRRVDEGNAPIPSRFNGMSGCSIWQAYYEGLSSKHWTTNDAVVVAVQTGVYKGGTVVRGTRWWVVDQIIRHNYPELAGPLAITTP
jgi:hypothetical protein